MWKEHSFEYSLLSTVFTNIPHIHIFTYIHTAYTYIHIYKCLYRYTIFTYTPTLLATVTLISNKSLELVSGGEG